MFKVLNSFESKSEAQEYLNKFKKKELKEAAINDGMRVLASDTKKQIISKVIGIKMGMRLRKKLFDTIGDREQGYEGHTHYRQPKKTESELVRLFPNTNDLDRYQMNLLIKVDVIDRGHKETIENVKSEITQGYHHIYDINQDSFYVAFNPHEIIYFQVSWLLDILKQGIIKVTILNKEV